MNTIIYIQFKKIAWTLIQRNLRYISGGSEYQDKQGSKIIMRTIGMRERIMVTGEKQKVKLCGKISDPFYLFYFCIKWLRKNT
ncbi:hypothetical protein bcgnr5372_66200 [Bacillus luti]|nr:hypothetical protein BCJMU02_1239 [Bacillus cereus]BCC46671.1 hypothetical protein BCJMU02_1980 [Bacillus cereus]HDR8334203.1 hypothetical protein [Bacillus cereus]